MTKRWAVIARDPYGSYVSTLEPCRGWHVIDKSGTGQVDAEN